MSRSPNAEEAPSGSGESGWRAAFQAALNASSSESNKSGVTVPEITVLGVTPDGARVDVELRFRAGERYCCAEPGCFLPVRSRGWWHRLRVCVESATGRAPPPLTIALRGVVENGAVLASLGALGLCEVSRAYSFAGPTSCEADAG